ncbi:MAG TPA: DinB family protein [Thermoanaerobaculia bacterium]|nr:DinB family protein [Thermoanaerobaculia bacterium]
MTLIENTLDVLKGMPAALEKILLMIPPADLTWTPDSWDGIPGERFSLIGQVCHLRDIEADGYHVRIRRMLEEENPDLVSLDSYALAAERKVDEATDIEDAYRSFRAAREMTLGMIGKLTGKDLRRTGTFAEYGAITLHGLLHFLCSHDQQHLACLHWLLGKITSRVDGSGNFSA